MVAAVLLPNAKAAFITSAGAPAVGYKLETYDAGTLVPRTTYLDAAGLANNTNPIVLDARGEAVIYWNGSYKVILKDPAGVTIWTADNVGFVLPGTATNDNAAAGIVGEFTQTILASGGALALTTNTELNVTSVPLTAGDWEVTGCAVFNGAAGTTVTRLISSLSSTSAVLGALGTTAQNRTVRAGDTPFATDAISLLCGPTRFSLAVPTTIYLVAFATFGVSTATVYGQIRARRAR